MSDSRMTLSEMGLIEWLKPGDHARVESLLADLRELGITRLRTQFSWAEWHMPGGAEWYDWLLPRLASEVEVLPCFTYTPPSLGIEARSSSPPREPKDYADFIDHIITRLGEHFEWIELWNEPNNLNDWDWQLDHDWQIFSNMIGMAAHWARHRGKKTLLGGMCPTDPNWLDMLCRRGTLDCIDAVGIHGFPDTWEFRGRGWDEEVARVREVLDRHGIDAELWLTEVGYSTWRNDEFEQLQHLNAVLQAPVDRIYWYGACDLHHDDAHQDGFHQDERHYHFGLRDSWGRPKLLYRILAAEGAEGVVELSELHRQSSVGLSRPPRQQPLPLSTRPVLITGGAGFVGTNLAARLMESGRSVLVYDNLSRPGSEHNLRWLRENYPKLLHVEVGDVRDRHLLRDAVAAASQVFHFAAQVAVTTSLDHPVDDFDINLRGTLNVLEAMRRLPSPPPLVFTSTNKVYGALDDLALEVYDARYQPRDVHVRETGIGETRPLDFHSPYGCSKGGADQYVLDYARSFDLRATVLRMSCIYGPHQFGNEDQGWVAHFLLRALRGEPITLYGDGRQVRDILFVEDLIDAMLLCQDHMERLSGRAFNIGGGPGNATSLIELLDLIGSRMKSPPRVGHEDWRTGDQRYYVSDPRAFSAATGWRPRVSVGQGVGRLQSWLKQHRLPAETEGRREVSA